MCRPHTTKLPLSVSYKRNGKFPNSYVGNSGEKRLHGRPEMRWRTLNSGLGGGGQQVVPVNTKIARFQVLMVVLITVHVFYHITPCQLVNSYQEAKQTKESKYLNVKTFFVTYPSGIVSIWANYEGWNFNFGNTPLDWIQELLEWRANATGRVGPSPTCIRNGSGPSRNGHTQ